MSSIHLKSANLKPTHSWRDGRLVGHRLKFDPADANQGAFFVAPAGEARVQVVACNKPGELIFMVPALPAADYTLEVRATVHGSEDVRTGA